MDHLEIYVSNLKMSYAFYSWLLPQLGFEAYQNWAAGFSFRKKDFYLVFVQTQAKYLANGYNRCNVGLNHLAFSVSSRAKVDFFKKQLEQQQVTLLYPDRYPYAGGKDHYACFFEDPDRIKLEIVARKKD